MNRKIVLTASLMLMLSIVLGAFAAHGLKNHLSVERLQTFEVGVRYQWYSSLSLLVLGLCSDKVPFTMKWVYALILTGTLFFSGSIYLISLSELLSMNARILGPVTPLGGALMISGWIVFAVKLFRMKSEA
jgi:uncharacterized membrane protein YgdD (TMEM256/DUF423 family)